MYPTTPRLQAEVVPLFTLCSNHVGPSSQPHLEIGYEAQMLPIECTHALCHQIMIAGLCNVSFCPSTPPLVFQTTPPKAHEYLQSEFDKQWTARYLGRSNRAKAVEHRNTDINGKEKFEAGSPSAQGKKVVQAQSPKAKPVVWPKMWSLDWKLRISLEVVWLIKVEVLHYILVLMSNSTSCATQLVQAGPGQVRNAAFHGLKLTAPSTLARTAQNS